MSVTRKRMIEELTNHVEKLEEELETLKYENGNLKNYLYNLGTSSDEIRDIKCGDLK